MTRLSRSVDAAAIDERPPLGSTESGRLLRNYSAISSINSSDALRKLAADGRMIGLNHARRWRCLRLQLDHTDPCDVASPVVVVTGCWTRLDTPGRPPSTVGRRGLGDGRSTLTCVFYHERIGI